MTLHNIDKLEHGQGMEPNMIGQACSERLRGPGSKKWKRNARISVRALRRYAFAFPVGEPRYQLWRGRFLRLAGRNDKARAALDRGCAAARRLGMPWDESCCVEAMTMNSLTPDQPG